MIENKSKIKNNIDKIDKKLIFRMRMFAVIFVLTLMYVVVDTFIYEVPFWYILIAFVVGMLTWLVLWRMQKITRDKDGYKIISRFDAIWVVILVMYIWFAIARHEIIADWVNSTAVTVVTVAVVNGTMLGRLLTMRLAIKHNLKQIKDKEE